jgi:hypothetical protein
VKDDRSFDYPDNKLGNPIDHFRGVTPIEGKELETARQALHAQIFERH